MTARRRYLAAFLRREHGRHRPRPTVAPLAGPPTVVCVHGLTVCEGCRVYRPVGPWRGVALAAPVPAPLSKTLLMPTIRGGQ